MLPAAMLGGVLFGLGASACWAIASVAVQRSARAAGAARAMFWAQGVGVAFVIVLAPLVDGPRAPFGAADAAWLVAAGGASLFAYICLFYAFEHGRLTVAVPVMSGWAVLSAALSLVLFHERVRPAQIGGAQAVLIGVAIVSRFSQREVQAAPGAGARPSWLLASLGGAVGFGLLIPAMGRLAPVLGSVGAIGAVYVADMALGLPFVWRGRISLALPRRSAWGAVAAAGVFETAGFACITLGARHAPLALVSPLASLGAALTVAYAWLVLRERPSPTVLIGAAIACAGVVVLSV
jgi:drug/metabolite transporter (DMT)-like permease